MYYHHAKIAETRDSAMADIAPYREMAIYTSLLLKSTYVVPFATFISNVYLASAYPGMLAPGVMRQ